VAELAGISAKPLAGLAEIATMLQIHFLIQIEKGLEKTLIQSLSGGENFVYRTRYSDWQKSINFDMSSRILEGTKSDQTLNIVFLTTEILVAESLKTIRVVSKFLSLARIAISFSKYKQAVLSRKLSNIVYALLS